MASPSGTLAEIIGVVRGILGLGRHGRLRERIRETLDLVDRMPPESDLADSRKNLVAAIESQSARLLEAEQLLARPRKRDWGALIVGLLATGLFAALPSWFVWPHLDEWWGVVLLSVLGIVGLVFLVASLSVFAGDKAGAEG